MRDFFLLAIPVGIIFSILVILGDFAPQEKMAVLIGLPSLSMYWIFLRKNKRY